MIDQKSILKIQDFESLVEFLAEKLDWPIDLEGFEDLNVLSYDFNPEELGIDEKFSAKILQIKQLRPLRKNQPWAVFWIDFEPRRLPITALRRILSKFVTKKRINDPDRASWDIFDLLFITGQGDDSHRGITFAHFHKDSDGREIIRDFSWDKTETHFYYISEYLKSLSWLPDNVTASDWKTKWMQAFSGSTRQAIRSSEELAKIMAVLAKDMKRRVLEVYEIEKEQGPLHTLYDSFKTVLIHDIKENDFADMYAQTITYGLFTARCMDTDGKFVLKEAVDKIPETNPFLKNLFRECFQSTSSIGYDIDLDELGINRIVELLDDLNLRDGTDQMQRILREFGRQTRGEDPVIHFYENFLNIYESEQRKRRGVYYTPDPVVSFIVRSVHEMIIKEFNLPLGLADCTTWGELVASGSVGLPNGMKQDSKEWQNLKDEPYIQILDFATGTGTFLKHTIQIINKTMLEHWESQKIPEDKIHTLWNDYVDKFLFNKIYGFELMMAPYSVCHMKLGLLLRQTGYEFGKSQRLKVYLTNTLDFTHTPRLSGYKWLSAESNEADIIKSKPITVIIGNPPYSKYSSNKTGFIADEKMKLYKEDVKSERNIQPLSNDYIKFIRFAHWKMESVECGVIGIITDNSYIDGLIHRGMRHELMKNFDDICILNLHGKSRTGETSHDGSKDENVFDIREGVCISFFVKRNNNLNKQSKVFYKDIEGLRSEKYLCLYENCINTFEWVIIKPENDNHFFVPKDFSVIDEYKKGMKLDDFFEKYSSGVKTHNDKELIYLHSKKLKDEKIYLYRPFDFRIINYDLKKVVRHRFNIMSNYIDKVNIGLIANRSTSNIDFSHVLISNKIIDVRCMPDFGGAPFLFPLFIYQNNGNQEGNGYDFLSKEDDKSVNFTKDFLQFIRTKYIGHYTPEQILGYIYAVLYSPTYRIKYIEFLKIDFPRIPFTDDEDLFKELSATGFELIEHHLLKKSYSGNICQMKGAGSNKVEKVKYENGRVGINSERYLEPVPEPIWNFHIGGYQVLDKWLKERKKHEITLLEEDIQHFIKVVNVLDYTIKTMQKIDELTREWI